MNDKIRKLLEKVKDDICAKCLKEFRLPQKTLCGAKPLSGLNVREYNCKTIMHISACLALIEAESQPVDKPCTKCGGSGKVPRPHIISQSDFPKSAQFKPIPEKIDCPHCKGTGKEPADKKSTTECRKNCDVYNDWQTLEAQNAGLVLDNAQLKARIIELEKTLPKFRDIIGLYAGKEPEGNKEYRQIIKHIRKTNPSASESNLVTNMEELCDKTDTLKAHIDRLEYTLIPELEAQIKELEERIELAVDCLPECPDEAKELLTLPEDKTNG